MVFPPVETEAKAPLDGHSSEAQAEAFFTDPAPVPVKASAAPLSPEMTVSAAFFAIAGENLRQIRANEAGALAGEDPEFLHQMRVALRRLRSAFSAFSRALPAGCDAKVKADLRWLGSHLGPARDWDVFVTQTLPAARTAVGAAAALEPLLAAAEKRRTAAHRDLRRALRSRGHAAAMLALSSWIGSRSWQDRADDEALAGLASPVRAYAQSELERRYERVRRRGRKLAELDAAGRHGLRIAIKKLRYPVEFFASLFDAEAAHELRARLVHLQDILGTMNDAATLQRLLSGLHADTRDVAMAQARGVLMGWSAGRGEALHAELERAWKRFRRTPTFW
jgi:CHAD domain-containing protein